MHPHLRAFIAWIFAMSFVAFVLNVAILAFAFSAASRNLRQYRRLLAWLALTDLACAALNVFTLEVAELRAGNVFLVSLALPAALAPLAGEFWTFSLWLTISNVPLQFAYRCSVLCESTRVTWRRLCFAYAILVSLAAINCFTFEYDCEGGSSRYRQILEENERFRDSDVSFFVCPNVSGLPTISILASDR